MKQTLVRKSKKFRIMSRALVFMCFLFLGIMAGTNKASALTVTKNSNGNYQAKVSTAADFKAAMEAKSATVKGKTVSFADNMLYVKLTGNINLTSQIKCVRRKQVMPSGANRTITLNGTDINAFNVIGRYIEFKGYSNRLNIYSKTKNAKSVFWVNGTGKLFLSSNVFVLNRTNSSKKNDTAGGIYLVKDGTNYPQATLDGATISNCIGVEGGAVLVTDGCTFTMKSGIIQNCYAKGSTAKNTGDGGGVCVTGGTFKMSGGKITGCSSTTEGGGVFVIDNKTDGFTMTGGTITNNTAEQEGGGIFIGGNTKATITAGTISNNITTTGSGGGLGTYYNSTLIIGSSGNGTVGSGPTITNNKAASSGGGLRINGGDASGKTTIYGATITGNTSGTNAKEATAGHMGGGISVYGGTFNCSNVLMTGNSTQNAGDGGAIDIGTSATISTFKNNKFYNNTATGNGGTINTASDLTINQTNVFTNGATVGNKASNKGGIIYTSAILNLSGTSASPLKMYHGATTNSSGGAIYGTQVSNINMSNYVYFGMNSAGGNGLGGAVCSAGTVNMNVYPAVTSRTIRFFDNTASDKGGAVAIIGAGNLTADHVSINSNKATNNGGGLYILNKVSKFTNGDIRKNVAKYGGGVYIADKENANVSMASTTIEHNKATSSGGGLFNNRSSSTVTLSSCTINENASDVTGAGVLNAGKVTLSNCSVTNNGGEITLTSTVTNETTNQHSNTCTYAVGTAVTPNGGGIYNTYEGTATVSGKVSGNVVTNNGGGIGNNGTLTLSAEVSGNKAVNGAGLYNGAYESTSNAYSSKATINGAKFLNNVATGKGGAVYITKYGSQSSTATINDITVNGNESKDYGSAICNYGTINKLKGSFEENTSSAYVIYNNGTVISRQEADDDVYIQNNDGIPVCNLGTFSLTNGYFICMNNNGDYEVLNGNDTLASIFNLFSVKTRIFNKNSEGISSIKNSKNAKAELKNVVGELSSVTKETIINNGTFLYVTTSDLNASVPFYISNLSSDDDNKIIYNDGICNVAAHATLVPGNKQTIHYGVYNDENGTLAIASDIKGSGLSSASETKYELYVGGNITNGIYNKGNVEKTSGNITECDYGVINENTVSIIDGSVRKCKVGILNGSDNPSFDNSKPMIGKITAALISNYDNAIITYAKISKISTESLYGNGNEKVDGSAILAKGRNASFLFDGTIATNTHKNGAVAVYDGANATLSGVLSGNSASDKGGAVYVGKNGTVKSTASYSSNKANDGGSVYIDLGGEYIETSGEHSRNNAGNKGNNVYVNGSDSEKGVYKIGNKASQSDGDVYLSQNTYIEVIDKMMSDTQFIIDTDKASTDMGRIVANVEYDENNTTGNSSLYITGDYNEEDKNGTFKKRFVSKDDKYITRGTQKLNNNGKISLFTKEGKTDANKNINEYKNNFDTQCSTVKNTNKAIFLTEKYTVTYHANLEKGVEVTGMPGNEKVENIEYTEEKYWNEDYTFSDKKPSAVKHEFLSDKSWNEKADGSGKVYALGSAYSDNSDIDVYAIWKSLTYSYDVTIRHLVMDTKGVYNQDSVSRQKKDEVSDNGMWTSEKILETSNIDKFTDEEKATLIDNRFVDDGFTYYDHMEVKNSNNGYPKEDGTTEINVYYARKTYTVTAFGDAGVYSLKLSTSNGKSDNANATHSDYKDDSAYDGTGLRTTFTYYANKKGTDVNAIMENKDRTKVLGWFDCDKTGSNYDTGKPLTGNKQYSFTVTKGEVNIIALTSKLGKVNISYYLEKQFDSGYDEVTSLNEIKLPDGFDVKLSSLVKDMNYDGITSMSKVTINDKDEHKDLNDTVSLIKGDTIKVYINRERYNVEFIPGRKVTKIDSLQIDSTEPVKNTQKTETEKLGSGAKQTYKAFINDDASKKLNISSESKVQLYATGTGQSDYLYKWFDVTDEKTIDDSVLDRCEKELLFSSKGASKSIYADNQNHKYVYTYVPEKVNVILEHYLMNSDKKYDEDPSLTIRMNNQPLSDCNVSLKDGVNKDYTSGFTYELEKVTEDVNNKEYKANEIDDVSIKPTSSNDVHVKYYYRLKEIKVKIYADFGFNGITVKKDNTTTDKVDLSNPDDRDEGKSVFETTATDKTVISLQATFFDAKAGYKYGQGSFLFCEPGDEADNHLLNADDFTDIDCDFTNLEDPVTKAIQEYGYLPIYLKSNLDPIGYTIVYNENLPGSVTAFTGHMDDQSVKYDEVFSLYKNQFYISKYYKFLGWATEPTQDEDKIVYQDKEGNLKNLTTEAGKVINLYAVWKEKKADTPNIHVEDKFFRVGTDINFDNLFEDVIISDGDGNIIDNRSSGLQIVGVSRIINDNLRTPIYPEDDAYDIADQGIDEADIGKYVSSEYERKYWVTVKAWNFKDGERYKSCTAAFKVVIWNTHRTIKYVRAISLFDLDTIPKDSKWASGELGAELIMSMYKSGYDEAKYVYRLTDTDVKNLRNQYKNNDYSWNKVSGWFKNNITPLKYPSYYLEQRKEY